MFSKWNGCLIIIIKKSSSFLQIPQKPLSTDVHSNNSHLKKNKLFMVWYFKTKKWMLYQIFSANGSNVIISQNNESSLLFFFNPWNLLFFIG